MSSGHVAAAERLLALAASQKETNDATRRHCVAMAQVHATLAVAAALRDKA